MTTPSFNDIVFAKEGRTIRLYDITIFLFQFMWKECIYIGLARSRNENRLDMTRADWLNERTNKQTNLGASKRTNERTREWTTGSPSSKYVVYATACVYRELYGKITDRKKNCVNNYLLWNKVFLPQMCGELVSCAEFRAILAPFSEVIRKPLLLLLKEFF